MPIEVDTRRCAINTAQFMVDLARHKAATPFERPTWANQRLTIAIPIAGRSVVSMHCWRCVTNKKSDNLYSVSMLVAGQGGRIGRDLVSEPTHTITKQLNC